MRKEFSAAAELVGYSAGNSVEVTALQQLEVLELVAVAEQHRLHSIDEFVESVMLLAGRSSEAAEA